MLIVHTGCVQVALVFLLLAKVKDEVKLLYGLPTATLPNPHLVSNCHREAEHFCPFPVLGISEELTELQRQSRINFLVDMFP